MKFAGFFLIALRSSIYSIADQIFALQWYFKSPRFLKADALLFWRYLLANPFKICQRHWKSCGYGGIPYGETPLKTLADIALLADIQPGDTWLDLGCGRGRGAFWLASCIGCQVLALDGVPAFATRGQCIAKSCDLKDKLTFLSGDFFSAPFEQATIIYLYGTGLESSTFFDLAIWLASLPKAPMIITVSASLHEVSPHFAPCGQFEGEFGWGRAPVYFQRRVSTCALTSKLSATKV